MGSCSVLNPQRPMLVSQVFVHMKSCVGRVRSSLKQAASAVNDGRKSKAVERANDWTVTRIQHSSQWLFYTYTCTYVCRSHIRLHLCRCVYFVCTPPLHGNKAVSRKAPCSMSRYSVECGGRRHWARNPSSLQRVGVSFPYPKPAFQ